MVTKEGWRIRLPGKRKLAAGLLAASILPSCSAHPHHAVDTKTPSNTSKTSQSTEARADVLWDKATIDLRNKIAAHRAVSLLVAQDVCLYWPAAVQGIDTVVRNPALYQYKEKGEELDFMPFIPSVPKNRKLEVMNGPYTYSNAARGIQNYGTMGAVVFQHDFAIFRLETSKFNLRQVTDPSPYTPGWLEATNGDVVSKTELVQDRNLETAFGGSCHLEPATQIV